jgi:hypothetical protein
MKVYFSASARAKHFCPECLDKIYEKIEQLGYTHVTDWMRRVDPDRFYKRTPEEAAKFYKEMIDGIKKADICVFETSLDSAGIGFSINVALDAGKPVVALYNRHHDPKRKAPYLLHMIRHPKIQVLEYTLENLDETLEDALEVAKDLMDIRFTFFLTPSLVNYLDFIKRERRMARATFIRRLIEGVMKKDKEYLQKKS